MTRPPDRVEVVTWTPTGGPWTCPLCGHQHWTWRASVYGWAPPLRFLCERPNCDCVGIEQAIA